MRTSRRRPVQQWIWQLRQNDSSSSEGDRHGKRKHQFFVAHHGDQTAIGFLAIGEMTVEVPGQGVSQGLLISGLAVDLSIQNVAVIRGLLRRAVAVRYARLQAKAYQFEAALVSENERIEAVLERAGFTRYEDAFWVRPIS